MAGCACHTCGASYPFARTNHRTHGQRVARTSPQTLVPRLRGSDGYVFEVDGIVALGTRELTHERHE